MINKATIKFRSKFQFQILLWVTNIKILRVWAERFGQNFQ